MHLTAEVPAYFNDIDAEVHNGTVIDTSPEPFATTVPYIPPQKITRITIRIAQAKTGAREIRLVSEFEDGKHKHFLIENVVIWPYTTSKTALMVGRKKKPVPMTENEAISAFHSEVATQFPPINLKGKIIAIHSNLL